MISRSDIAVLLFSFPADGVMPSAFFLQLAQNQSLQDSPEQVHSPA